MKRVSLLMMAMLLLLTGCMNRGAKKAEIIAFYRQNESVFHQAAASGDFSAVAELEGVEDVYEADAYVQIYCHYAGIVPSSSYFGLYYSPADDLRPGRSDIPADALVPDGDGFRWQQHDGDNQYQVVPLGNHYFYFDEAY